MKMKMQLRYYEKTTRYSERIREKEETKYKAVLDEIREITKLFKHYDTRSQLSEIERATKISNVYSLILQNIRLFHKFCNEETIKILFTQITKKGNEILLDNSNNKKVEKIIKKPILNLIKYIYKYNESIYKYNEALSRVTYKLSTQLNYDVSFNILSFIR